MVLFTDLPTKIYFRKRAAGLRQLAVSKDLNLHWPLLLWRRQMPLAKTQNGRRER